MADNTTIDAQAGGDAIRSKDRSGIKTQVVMLDLNTGGAETLMAGVLPVKENGTYAYATGTAAATVDVPAGARVKRVFVYAGASAATVAIAGGATITIPAGASFDEQIPGDATAGADVVIGGTVSSYYVSWVA